jgi:hypothetical protein
MRRGTVAQKIMVPFSGEGAGVEELTWGQRNIWRMMQIIGTPEMVGGAMPLEEGTTVEHIKNLLAFIMSRHQSLRTRVRLDPDGNPMQQLFDSGEVPLEIVDIADDEDPAVVAEAKREHFEVSDFDIENEWPVRMAIIRQHGIPVYFTAMYPHIVIDGYGFEALVGDLANLDRDTGEHLGPRAGIQPIDLARQQRTPALKRQSAAAMRYWEQQLQSVPPRRFNESRDKHDPRYWDATYDSPAAYLAASAIAARTNQHTSTILLTSYAIALARVTRIGPSVIRMMISNRFRPDYAESVSVMVQPGLCVIDVADCGFDEAAARAWRSQLIAGKYGYYDPRDLWALMERVSHERGTELDLMCYFNDRRMGQAPAPSVSNEDVHAALPLSKLEWGVRSNNPDAKAYLNINTVPDTLNYTLRADTYALSPLETVEVLRTMEEVLVAAAFDPLSPTLVSHEQALAK